MNKVAGRVIEQYSRAVRLVELEAVMTKLDCLRVLYRDVEHKNAIDVLVNNLESYHKFLQATRSISQNGNVRIIHV